MTDERRERGIAGTVGSTVCVLALGLTVAGCQIGVLHPRGPVGEAQRTILVNAVVIMLTIVVPTIVATLGVAWWFRAGNPRARYRPDWSYSGQVELVTWSIPVLVVFFLGGIAWIGSHDLDPAKPLAGEGKPLDVQVVSLDWKWLFLYPAEGVASVNRVVVPVGRPLRLALTSASVMNAFFVPQLGSMIYTMNGMTTRLNLQADGAGSYEGLSAHFSGDGFPGMRFRLEAVDADGFERFLAEAKAGADALDEARYRDLTRQSRDDPPATFRLADPRLFEAIAGQALPPGPGPAGGQPPPAVSPRPAAAICTPTLPRG